MKNQHLFKLITLTIIIGITHLLNTKGVREELPKENSSKFGVEMVDILNNMKAYTIQIALKMPEDKYGFKPTEETRSFKEQLEHITAVLDFHLDYILGSQKMDRQSFVTNFRATLAEVSGKSKQELISIVSDKFDKALNYFKNVSDADLNATYSFTFFPGKPVKTMRTISMGLRDHITHHRAQMIVYMRLNGIVPDNYQLF